MGDGKFQCNTQLRSGGDEVPGKITVRNYTTLTDYAALLRAGMYLAGKKEEAEDNGFRFKVTESERHGVVVNEEWKEAVTGTKEVSAGYRAGF